MGSVMPPATEAVMSVVPRERAGSGSALTNTARQVFGALGVAVLGSILAQVYRGQLSPHLTALPDAARNAAASSITGTQTVAGHLGSAGLRLDTFADGAFVHAMHVTTVISAVITLAGALVVLAWMPGRTAARTALAEEEAREDTVVMEPEPAEIVAAAPVHEDTVVADIPAALRAEVAREG
jgi:MFS transporter, DHA2 family, multidrug resistance protein